MIVYILSHITIVNSSLFVPKAHNLEHALIHQSYITEALHIATVQAMKPITK